MQFTSFLDPAIFWPCLHYNVFQGVLKHTKEQLQNIGMHRKKHFELDMHLISHFLIFYYRVTRDISFCSSLASHGICDWPDVTRSVRIYTIIAYSVSTYGWGFLVGAAEFLGMLLPWPWSNSAYVSSPGFCREYRRQTFWQRYRRSSYSNNN